MAITTAVCTILEQIRQSNHNTNIQYKELTYFSSLVQQVFY